MTPKFRIPYPIFGLRYNNSGGRDAKCAPSKDLKDQRKICFSQKPLFTNKATQMLDGCEFPDRMKLVNLGYVSQYEAVYSTHHMNVATPPFYSLKAVFGSW